MVYLLATRGHAEVSFTALVTTILTIFVAFRRPSSNAPQYMSLIQKGNVRPDSKRACDFGGNRGKTLTSVGERKPAEDQVGPLPDRANNGRAPRGQRSAF